MASEKNQQLIEGLRRLLAFVEANQDFEFVPGADKSIVRVDFHTWYLNGEDNQRLAIADLTRRMAGAGVGKVEKLYSDDYAWIRLAFGEFIQFDITTLRKTICERVVVGKKVIAAQPERVIAASPERTEEEVEWRCHPVLTAGSSHTIDGQMGELESGTDAASLQLESGGVAVAEEEAEEEDNSIPL